MKSPAKQRSKNINDIFFSDDESQSQSQQSLNEFACDDDDDTTTVDITNYHNHLKDEKFGTIDLANYKKVPHGNALQLPPALTRADSPTPAVSALPPPSKKRGPPLFSRKVFLEMVIEEHGVKVSKPRGAERSDD